MLSTGVPICNDWIIPITFIVALVILRAAAVAQWVSGFDPETKGWVFESHPRQT